jgi:hypothetical protein
MLGIWGGRRWCGRSKEVAGRERDEEVAGGAALVEGGSRKVDSLGAHNEEGERGRTRGRSRGRVVDRELDRRAAAARSASGAARPAGGSEPDASPVFLDETRKRLF